MRCFSLEATDLLEQLKRRGIRLSLSHDRQNLVVRGKLDDELRQQIRENKKGLIALVEAGEANWQVVAVYEFDPETGSYVRKTITQ